MAIVCCQTLAIQEKLLRWGILGLWMSLILEAGVSGITDSLPLKFCPLQWLLSFPCPTCGLTRSLLALLQGDLHQALMYHLFGPVVFLVGLIVGVQAGVELWTGRSLGFSKTETLTTTYRQFLSQPKHLCLILTLLFAYYGLRLYARYTIGVLPFQLDQSPLWGFIVNGAKLL